MNWIVQLNFLEFWSCLFFESVTSVEEFFRNLSQMTVLRVQISPGICAFLVRSIEADKIYWCFMSCGEVAFLSEFLKESGRGMRHYITQEDLQNLQPPEAEADRSECLKFDSRYVVDTSKKPFVIEMWLKFAGAVALLILAGSTGIDPHSSRCSHFFGGTSEHHFVQMEATPRWTVKNWA